MPDNRPIGVFDSGLGGVSVLKDALALLPSESFIYYGDNKNAPYGSKTPDEITRLALECAHFLLGKGVKLIVVACNTATSAAILHIRDELSIPVISMEPAIKPACANRKEGEVLMLATPATIAFERYQALKARMPSSVIDVPCPGLAARIEQGITAQDAFDDLLGDYLAPYENMSVDAIVLGCTHYIFIKDAIARYAKAHFRGSATLYDGNYGTVRQLARVLEQNDMCTAATGGAVEFFTSGDEKLFMPMFWSLLGQPQNGK